jgi:predicted amidohydrolase YtcJ
MSASETAPRTTLLRGGVIHAPNDPPATAMVVEGDHIAWIGTDAAAPAHTGGVDEVIDLHGALVTPAFVDAHVHTTATGLALTGLDLSAAASGPGLLDLLAAHAATLPADAVIIASGWDESGWPEPQAPGRAEIDRAVGGRAAYLSRVDVHSAMASSALLDRIPEAAGAPGFAPAGPLTRDAHHLARAAAFASVSPAQRAAAQQAALRRAAELGIGAVHECGGPVVSSEADLTGLLALAAQGPNPYVFGYWGELADPGKARELGAVGAGGDLFIDGALGSRTACLREAYTDAPEDPTHAGNAYLEADEIAGFLVSCVEAGVQPGFHVIGDYALDILVAALDLAHDLVGEHRLRAIQVRAEHAEMLDAQHIKKFAHHGVVVSAQPGFDAAWGGPDGMYAQRLGAHRAETMNPLAALTTAGVALAFGSDSPVTALGPWAAVQAAVFHHSPQSRMTVHEAFTAHTRGGWRALLPGAATVPADETGLLAPGAAATYAVWQTSDLVVPAPDARVAAGPALPDLTPGVELPRCLRTVVRGQSVHDLLV